MKRIKKTQHSTYIQDHQFFIDSLKSLFYGISCRFVILLSFFSISFLSFGQGLHTDANALPIIGLENVYNVPQEQVAPVLFVSPATIISKSVATVLYVNGWMQKDSLIVTSIAMGNFSVAMLKEEKHRTKPEATVASSDVSKSNDFSALPILPWKNNTLQQETFFTSVVVISLPTTPLPKKNIQKSFHFFQASEYLLHQVVITKGCAACFTGSVASTFGENSTDFSSRPPPISMFT